MAVLLNVATVSAATAAAVAPSTTDQATSAGAGTTPLVLAATPWVPHKGVVDYVDENGNILPDILTGERALPPPLALPGYYRHDNPGLPRALKECLSGTPAAAGHAAAPALCPWRRRRFF